MCRVKGTRANCRCHEDPSLRRQRQRAAYQAKVAAQRTVGVPGPQGGLASCTPTVDRPALGLDSPAKEVRARLAEQVVRAQAMLDASQRRQGEDGTSYPPEVAALFARDDDGWTQPTEHGVVTEEAVRGVGGTVALRAEQLAADDLAKVGQSSPMRKVRPEGFASRQDYHDHAHEHLAQVVQQRQEIEQRMKDAVDADARGAAWVEAHAKYEEHVQVAETANRIANGTSDWDHAEARIHARATLEALAEQREMGLRGGQMIPTHPSSVKAGVGRLEKALDYYPTSWTDRDAAFEAQWETQGFMEASHRASIPLVVSSARNGRASYLPVTYVNQEEPVYDTSFLPPGSAPPETADSAEEMWVLKKGADGEGGYAVPTNQPTAKILDDPRRGTSYTRMLVVTEPNEYGDTQMVRRPVSVLNTDSRDNGSWLGKGVCSTVHEYGHRASRVNPVLNDLEQTHLARRTTNDDGSRATLEPMTVSSVEKRRGAPADMYDFEDRYQGSGKSEWTRSDGFTDRYMGRQYRHTDSTETFTTGMEGVFGGRYGGLRGAGKWKADPEHRNFILGCLATVR